MTLIQHCTGTQVQMTPEDGEMFDRRPASCTMQSNFQRIRYIKNDIEPLLTAEDADILCQLKIQKPQKIAAMNIYLTTLNY